MPRRKKDKPPSHFENRLSNRIAKLILALLRDEFGFFIISLLYMFSTTPIVEILHSLRNLQISKMEQLHSVLRGLTEEEQMIIRALYLDNPILSQSELAARLGITKQAISKKHLAILDKLRRLL